MLSANGLRGQCAELAGTETDVTFCANGQATAGALSARAKPESSKSWPSMPAAAPGTAPPGAVAATDCAQRVVVR